jgi:hypothetical protein
MSNRSKEETKLWLKTEQGQQWLEKRIEQNCVGKSACRKLKTIKKMQQLGLHYDCSKCLHEIGHHCSWHLPDGCPDFLMVGSS